MLFLSRQCQMQNKQNKVYYLLQFQVLCLASVTNNVGFLDKMAGLTVEAWQQEIQIQVSKASLCLYQEPATGKTKS